MRTARLLWTEATGWRAEQPPDGAAQLVLYFGSRDALADGRRFAELRGRFPVASIVGCSTGGQMTDRDVTDDAVVALALRFESTTLRAISHPIAAAAESAAVGTAIGEKLAAPDLAGIFLLSEGLGVNGSGLVAGITGAVGEHVRVSGGLAGDPGEFRRTLVGCNRPPRSGLVAAIGLYGADVRIGNGCAGGWDVFGPLRSITRAEGNVLHELDGRPALDLYKLYLGAEDSRRLPGSALLFPLRIRKTRGKASGVVRTVLGVDHATGSMTFAGDMPQGWSAQLMRGAITRLCDSAADAARSATAAASLDPGDGGAAILVSCIGRRLLMGQRIENEVEATLSALAPGCVSAGFYSFGEISPDDGFGSARLHNQTMAVTVIGEKRTAA